MDNNSSTVQQLSGIPTRADLIQDVIIFQLKLLADGLRDFVIAPVSIVAGIIDLAIGRKHFKGYFYSVLKAGRSTEEWINLFSQVERANG